MSTPSAIFTSTCIICATYLTAHADSSLAAGLIAAVGFTVALADVGKRNNQTKITP